jgi:hypothetical protein
MKPKIRRNLIGIVSLFAFLLALEKAVAQSYDCDNPPIILCHPECRLVQAGTSNVTFSVMVENPLEIPNFQLTYQWQKNVALGKSEYENISGATNEVYTIPHQVEDLDVAFYRVLATGSGTATSAPAALQIWTTNSPLTVSGPIAFFAPPKTKGSCPGTYSAVVCFGCKCTNNVWGFIPNSANCVATDTARSDTKVEFSGNVLHTGCNAQSVSFTATNPYYRFSIYFRPPPAPQPSSGVYSIVLDGITVPASCPSSP